MSQDVLHFMDVGVWKGEVAALVLKSPRENLRVHLFEPDPDRMAALRVKFEHDTRVNYYEAVLTDREGVRSFYVPAPGHEGSSLFADKKTSAGAPTIQVEGIAGRAFIEALSPGPVVLYSNCEGGEFEFLPEILASDVRDRIALWSISWHNKKIPSMEPAFQEIKATMKRLGIEVTIGHFVKDQHTRPGGLRDQFVDTVLSLSVR